MAETPAQRKARERNLRKGNPSAYANGSQGETQEESPPAEDEGGAGKTTFRARTTPAKSKAKPKSRRKPASRRTPPRAPADDPPPARSGGGFLDGFFKGLGG